MDIFHSQIRRMESYFILIKIQKLIFNKRPSFELGNEIICTFYDFLQLFDLVSLGYLLSRF